MANDPEPMFPQSNNDPDTGGSQKVGGVYNSSSFTLDNVDRGLVLRLKSNEGTGTTLSDSSGNSNNGTLTNGVWKSLTNTRTSATRNTTAGRSTA